MDVVKIDTVYYKIQLIKIQSFKPGSSFHLFIRTYITSKPPRITFKVRDRGVQLLLFLELTSSLAPVRDRKRLQPQKLSPA
jgi:hypothetical protein